ncbi:MAG: hypothetical protein LUD15_15250 [Bacteroides sp.]|nr:hypothetical protein [Bacteroides sp.]
MSIPVSQTNRYYEKYPNTSDANYYETYPIKENEALKIKFLWTDHENGFNKGKDGKSPIKSIEFEPDNDKGPGARIVVTPGSEPGNAVIAVTDNSDNIHWSWHIWVVDTNENFDPYNESTDWHNFRYYQFLDRNLGALSADGENPESMGFHYQWGRKDPFPAAS